VLVGYAFVQNLRRGHYELATEEPMTRRLPVAFDELALAIRSQVEVTLQRATCQRNATAPTACRRGRAN
jgi:hypothetical protein